MKAVIVDLNGNDAVALRDDGQFIKLKNSNYRIGQEIPMQAQTVRFPKQVAIAASAALVVFAGGGMGTYTWSNPISYVSLDINPSIAYSLNEFNRVIAVNGMNDEGVAVVDAIGGSLKNVDITTALTITVEQLSTDAYLNAEDTNYMVIGVYSDKDSKADALMSTVDAFTADTVETCSITTVNVSKETKESADSYGITGGKMELINEIASVAEDPETVDPAVLADMTVAELEQTKEAAASGASVTDAVAAVSPSEPQTPEDPNAVASEGKPSENTSETSSSSKKDDPTDEPASADTDSPAAENNQSPPPAETTSSADNTAANSSANSTDKTGNGSSDKKDDTTSSDSKDTTSSSEKKDSESSSSDKKDSSSSEKKDDVSEDSSEQTNSNIDTEVPADVVPATPAEAAPITPSAVEVEQIFTGNMLS